MGEMWLPWTTCAARARILRDQHYAHNVTFARSLFPVTQLCRDVCHCCTFAKTPSQLDTLYLELDDILATVREGAAAVAVRCC